MTLQGIPLLSLYNYKLKFMDNLNVKRVLTHPIPTKFRYAVPLILLIPQAHLILTLPSGIQQGAFPANANSHIKPVHTHTHIKFQVLPPTPCPPLNFNLISRLLSAHQRVRRCVNNYTGIYIYLIKRKYCIQNTVELNEQKRKKKKRKKQ